MNKDVFRDRPIVPEDLENLPTDQQFDERTSETARRIGKFLNYSPMKIDHLLRQGAMWDVMGALDAGLRAIDDDEDPYIVGLAERLKDIQENLKPDQVKLERRRFLGDLSQKDRDAVLLEERKPEPEEYQYRFKGFPLPFAKSVERRFYRKQSGNLYRSGQAAAQKATGIDPKQTREASIIIGNEMDKLQTTQEQVDAALEAGKIDHAQWRGVHKDSGKLYQGVLGVIQTRFPKAGQVAKPADWVDYMEHVATVGKTMPDRRSKGDLLYAAWRGIAPEELAPGTDSGLERHRTGRVSAGDGYL